MIIIGQSACIITWRRPLTQCEVIRVIIPMFSVFKFWIKHVTTSRRCLRRTLFQILWCVAVYSGNMYRYSVVHYSTGNTHIIIRHCCRFIVNFISDMRLLPHSHTRIPSWHSAWTVEIAHLKWKKYLFLTRANRHFNRPSMMHRRQLDTKIKSDSSTSTCRCTQTHVALNVGILWHWSTIKLCSFSMRTTKKERCDNFCYTLQLGAENMCILTWRLSIERKNSNSDYLFLRCMRGSIYF